MIKQGDMVVYRCRGMYRVEQIGKLDFSGVDKKKDYFTLKSMENPKETFYIPAEETRVRRPVSREEALELLQNVQDEDIIWVANERMREQEYKQCILSGSVKEWLRILKTLYLRDRNRGTLTSVDKKYREMAERALFGELSFALNMTEKEVGNYVKEQIGSQTPAKAEKC